MKVTSLLKKGSKIMKKVGKFVGLSIAASAFLATAWTTTVITNGWIVAIILLIMAGIVGMLSQKTCEFRKYEIIYGFFFIIPLIVPVTMLMDDGVLKKRWNKLEILACILNLIAVWMLLNMIPFVG